MANYTIPQIPVLATQVNDTDLFEKADGPAGGQSQRVTGLVMKTYMQSGVGQQCFSGSGAPTTQVPANGAGTYYDKTNKIIYNYNPDTPGWE